MRAWVYNASIAAGVTLTSVGAGLVYLPAGFIVAGALTIGLTVAAAMMTSRRG